jgi:hypothetical protein
MIIIIEFDKNKRIIMFVILKKKQVLKEWISLVTNKII